MPKFDLIDDRFGEPLPISAMEVDQIEPQRIAPIDDVENQFVIDALTFFNSSTDVYPIYSFENIVTKSILLGADVSSMNEVPMIVIEEPTATIHIDDDQQVQRVPVDEENRVTNEIDVRVPQDESMIKEFHMSKKKRHATNAINRKRKYPSLFNKIVQFDFETLKFLREENDQIWKRRQDEEIPWPTLIGRVRDRNEEKKLSRTKVSHEFLFFFQDGKKRMENLLEKAKTTIETSDLGIMIDDVTKIAKILTNPSKNKAKTIFVSTEKIQTFLFFSSISKTKPKNSLKHDEQEKKLPFDEAKQVRRTSKFDVFFLQLSVVVLQVDFYHEQQLDHLQSLHQSKK